MCILRFDWLIGLYLFMSLVRNASFLIIKNSCVREELIDLRFFFRHNFNRSLCKNIFLVSSHSRPLPLVRAPPQLTPSPSPTTFRLCPLLPASPSTAAPFAQYTITNAFNARSTSSIILAEEGVLIFSPRIRFSNLAITTFILA